MKGESMKKALYPGSFDGIHKGHESIIKVAATLFDHVAIGITHNSSKSHMFTVNERIAMMNKLVEHMANVHVVTVPKAQFTVDYAERIGCQFMIRGIRNFMDLTGEQAMCDKNLLINPNIRTVFLMTEPKFANVSSSGHKVMWGIDRWEKVVKDEVPESIWPMYTEMLSGYGIHFSS